MKHENTFKPDRDVKEWKGATRPYDIAKEVVACSLVMVLLTVALAVLFGSPDDPAVTLKQWATATPIDFAATAAAELDGSAGTPGYGPPYNVASSGPSMLGISPAKVAGVHIAVDAAKDFVLSPVASLPQNPAAQLAISTFERATAEQQQRWAAAYTAAVNAPGVQTLGGRVLVGNGNFGPVPVIVDQLVAMAQSGALDTTMLTQQRFFSTDFTKPLLFLSDGSYFANKAAIDHLQGDQWGMMNETGAWPGQAWLWLYTMWYQVPGLSTSDNADLQVWVIMMGLTALLLFVPFIPGLRSIPRISRVYRLIWRAHYRTS